MLAIAQYRVEKRHKPVSRRSGSHSGSKKDGRSGSRRSPVSPRPHRSSRTYPSKQANGHDCTAWGTPRYKFSVSATRVLILCSDFTFETLDYWSVGVLKDSSEFDFNPSLHYSTTPSPIPYLHGLGSKGFTPISNKAGPGCARARPRAGCKSRAWSTRSP